jgi:hypothetical protein
MQFAYNMSSIFLIRLLQRFENIRLALDAQPPGSLPPAEWATEDRPLDPRKAEEKVSPKTSINMSVKVSTVLNSEVNERFQCPCFREASG